MTITTSRTKETEMSKLSYALIVAAACSLGACSSLSPFTPGTNAAGQPAAQATQDAAAKEGLATFIQLVNESNYAALGFGAVDEVRQATLAPPMPVFRIELEALRAFTGQGDAESLLVDARRTLF